MLCSPQDLVVPLVTTGVRDAVDFGFGASAHANRSHCAFKRPRINALPSPSPGVFRAALMIIIITRDKNPSMHDAVQAAALPSQSRGM
jgi:hypothetical protein